MSQIVEEYEEFSTHPPVQCASEEMPAYVLPQLVPHHFESVGIGFAHAASDASCLFGPEIACEVQTEQKISLSCSHGS